MIFILGPFLLITLISSRAYLEDKRTGEPKVNMPETRGKQGYRGDLLGGDRHQKSQYFIKMYRFIAVEIS